MPIDGGVMANAGGIALGMVAVFALPGCTIINIDGAARVTQVRPGIVRIDPAGGAHLVVYRSRGLGIVPGTNGVTIGAKVETVALVYAPEDCRVILFDPKPDQVRAMVDMVTAISPAPESICNVGGKRDEKIATDAGVDAAPGSVRHD